MEKYINIDITILNPSLKTLIKNIFATHPVTYRLLRLISSCRGLHKRKSALGNRDEDKIIEITSTSCIVFLGRY